jgi:hypothetical protein
MKLTPEQQMELTCFLALQASKGRLLNLIHSIKMKITRMKHLLAAILSLSTIAGITSCSDISRESAAKLQKQHS